MDISTISSLTQAHDWLDKAEHDLFRFRKTKSVYAMADCFLSLNALVDWTRNSIEIPEDLIKIAIKKNEVMCSGDRDGDYGVEMLDDIDLLHRAVRSFCNHAKHMSRMGSTRPIVEIDAHTVFPAVFPIAFDRITIAGYSIAAEDVLSRVMEFWQSEFEKNGL